MIIRLQIVDSGQGDPFPLLLRSWYHIDRELLSREGLWPIRCPCLASLDNLLHRRPSFILQVSYADQVTA